MPRFQQVTLQKRRGAGLGITSPGVWYDNYSNNATQVFSVNDASNGNECNTGDEKMANKVVNNSQVNSSSPSHERTGFPNYRKRRKKKNSIEMNDDVSFASSHSTLNGDPTLHQVPNNGKSAESS